MKLKHFISFCIALCVLLIGIPMAVSALSETSMTDDGYSCGAISLTLSAPKYAFAGTSFTLETTYSGNRKSDKMIVPVLTKQFVAKAGGDGTVIYAKAPGNGTITVSDALTGCSGGCGKTLSAKVGVTVLNTVLEVDPTQQLLSVGESMNLTFSYSKDKDAEGLNGIGDYWAEALKQLVNITPDFTVTGDAVTVEKGVVTAVKVGTSVITVTIPHTSIKATCTVTVMASDTNIKVSTIAIPTASTIIIGQSKTITPVLSPIGSSNAAGTWSLSKTGIVTLEGNTFTAVGVGQVTATYTLEDRTRTASCIITVTENMVRATAVSLPSKLTVGVGETASLTPVFTPSNATNQNGVWIITAAGIVSRSGNEFTGLAAGSVTVIFKSEDSSKTASCLITVINSSATPTPVVKITGITVDKTSSEWVNGKLHIKAGSDYTVDYYLTPANANRSALIWTTSDTAVATVTDDVIHARAAGTATITIEAPSGVKQRFTVIVS